LQGAVEIDQKRLVFRREQMSDIAEHRLFVGVIGVIPACAQFLLAQRFFHIRKKAGFKGFEAFMIVRA
jgi:hypothetical protein